MALIGNNKCQSYSFCDNRREGKTAIGGGAEEDPCDRPGRANVSENSCMPDVVLSLADTSSLEHEYITGTYVLLLTHSLSKRK